MSRPSIEQLKQVQIFVDYLVDEIHEFVSGQVANPKFQQQLTESILLSMLVGPPALAVKDGHTTREVVTSYFAALIKTYLEVSVLMAGRENAAATWMPIADIFTKGERQ